MNDSRVSPIVATDIDQLKPNPENPRTIGDAQLELLKAQLLADPDMLEARPVIALPDGTVVAGNQRLAAASSLGWTKIPVATADLDESQARVWMLRDNTQAGDWDNALLADVLAGLPTDMDVALTGLDSALLDRVLPAPARATDPDDVPDLPAVPLSKLGEVYELGPHRLMCGDGTNASQVAELLGGSVADILFTDPPYGVNYQGDEDPESLRRRNRRADGKATVANDALGDGVRGVSDRKPEDRQSDTLKLVDGARIKFAQRLHNPDDKIGGAELAALVKLEREIEASPAAPIAVEPAVEPSAEEARLTKRAVERRPTKTQQRDFLANLQAGDKRDVAARKVGSTASRFRTLANEKSLAHDPVFAAAYWEAVEESKAKLVEERAEMLRDTAYNIAISDAGTDRGRHNLMILYDPEYRAAHRQGATVNLSQELEVTNVSVTLEAARDRLVQKLAPVLELVPTRTLEAGDSGRAG